jgi:hypothetical protein
MLLVAPVVLSGLLKLVPSLVYCEQDRKKVSNDKLASVAECTW